MQWWVEACQRVAPVIEFSQAWWVREGLLLARCAGLLLVVVVAVLVVAE